MRRGGLVAVVAVLAASACSGATQDSSPAPPTVTPTARVGALRLLQPLAVHHATALADGEVLITGGCTLAGCGGFEAARRTQLFDPRLSRFRLGPTMLSASAAGTATLLDDGRVLLTGGYPAEGSPPTADAELFDPRLDGFTSAGSLLRARADHSATLLADGRVLLCGGFDAARRPLRTCELFDPSTNLFTPGPRMSTPRAAHVAVLVHGRVVLVGGTATGQALTSTDQLRGNTWSPGPDLLVGRVKLAAAVLPRGQILVIGGATTTEGRAPLSSTEIIDLPRTTVRAGPELSEGEYKLEGAVARLADGRLVIAGGQHLNVYDPASGTMAVLTSPSLQRRSFVTATAVAANAVLVAGGYDDAIVPTNAASLVRIPAARD